MRALVLRGRNLAVEEVETPVPGPGQVLARVRACGICGSDLHFARYAADMQGEGGVLRNADVSEGVVMGHEFVAEVVQPGPGVQGLLPGTRVTSVPLLPAPDSPRGSHSIGYSSRFPGAYGEYVLMGAPLLLPVPEHVPDEVAATTEPTAVALHAVREARVQPDDRALVMGAGPIGLLTLLWLRKMGVRQTAVSDPAPARRALAHKLGVQVVLDPTVDDLAARMADAFGATANLVFECVGVEGTLHQAMELAPARGRIVVVGVCMVEDRIRPLVAINKQLNLQFVLGYTLDEYREALEAIGDGSIDPSPLVTRKVSLDELPAAFQSLSDPSDCKVVLTFPDRA